LNFKNYTFSIHVNTTKLELSKTVKTHPDEIKSVTIH